MSSDKNSPSLSPPPNKKSRTSTTVASLPNETLLDIFSRLSFKDAVQCSYACRRFFDIITASPRQFYLGSWKVNQPAPHDVFFARPSPDSLLVVYRNGAVDLFEYHPFDTKLYCTATCKESTLVNVRDVIRIPYSKRLVYFTKESTGFYLTDMPSISNVDTAAAGGVCYSMGLRDPGVSSARLGAPMLPSSGAHHFTEIGGGRLSRIFCSGEPRSDSIRIVCAKESYDESYNTPRKISVYSVKNQETSPIFEVIAASPCLDMSKNGLLFYRPPEHENRICILNVHSSTELAPIDVGDFPFRDMSTNPDGTHLVIGHTRTFRLYEVASGKVLFSLDQGYVTINRSWFYHLIDARFVVVINPAYGFTSIFSLSEDCRSALFCSELRNRMIYSYAYRRLDASPHIQLIDDKNQLKLLRFNDRLKRWDEI